MKTDLEIELVAIARILRPRGLRGEVAAEMLTDFPERFEGLHEIIALLARGEREKLKIEEFWFQKNRLVLKFEGIESIDDAERLREAEICIPESEAVELEPDEYYDWQLVDCEVVTLDGKTIGRVSRVMRTVGAQILVVDGEKEILIPFAEQICTEVDIDNKLIRIDPPEGLLEF